MESIYKITETLESMLNAHIRLLDLVKEKRNVLVDGAVSSIQSLTYQESLCADEIQRLEQQRQHHVQAYMAEHSVSTGSYTLEDVLKHETDAGSKTTLTKIAKQLRGLIEEISHLNESNQQLIQTSLTYIQYAMGLHIKKEPSIGYGPKAGNRYSNLLDAKI